MGGLGWVVVNLSMRKDIQGHAQGVEHQNQRAGSFTFFALPMMLRYAESFGFIVNFGFGSRGFFENEVFP